MEILGVTPEADWPRLRFAFHPSVVLAEAPAIALASTRRSSAAMKTRIPPDVANEDLTLLVWREKLDVQYRALDELEALALREALAKKPFGEICALLAFARPEEAAEVLTAMAAGFLASWFHGGLIVAAASKAE